MSDYSKKTDDELNDAIAVKKGWVFSECIDCHHEYWIAPDGAVDYNESDPPDYTNDWRLAGKLLEEMKFTAVSLFFNQVIDKWGIGWIDEYNSHHCLYSPTPQRAICEAWLAWKGQE